MARDGSAGVENTFRTCNVFEDGSIQTQSVKVPPVSMAMRSGTVGRAGIVSAPHEYIGGDENKEDHCNDTVHGEECGVKLAQIVSTDQGLFVGKQESHDDYSHDRYY